MEAHMKLTIPGLLVMALIVASSAAFAQNTSTGNASTPGASVAKDDTATMTKRSKKHTASYKKKHHAKAMSSKPQTTGSGPRAQTAGSGSASTPSGRRY